MTISNVTTERLKDIASDVAMQGYASEEEQQAMARELLAVRGATPVWVDTEIHEAIQDILQGRMSRAGRYVSFHRNQYPKGFKQLMPIYTAPPAPAVQHCFHDAIDDMENVMVWIMKLPVPTDGATAKAGRLKNSIAACRAAMLQSCDAVRDLSTPVDPQIAEYEQALDMVGMSVSVDVSTSDDNAGYRYFGRITEVQQSANPKDKGGVVLLVQDDVESNFDDGIAPDGYKLMPIDLINDLRNAAHFEKASYAASFGSHIDTGRWKDEYEQLTATCKAVDDLLAATPTPTK